MNLDNAKCFKQRVFIGNLTSEHLNKTVTIAGWVKRIKKLGELNFVIVGDKTNTIQVTCKNKEQVKYLTREDLVIVKGKLKRLDSVRFEITNPTITLFAKSKTPPLIIEDKTDALEEVRLRYRYLDLRRPVMQKRLALRHKVTLAVRNWLDQMGFIEVETPTLTKSTPEGARDFLVPARIREHSFYALPQSPQIYKQLLMVGGTEKYFQIAHVYRDEDSRKDRQSEHTQIDLEVAFYTKEMVMDLIQRLFVDVFRQVLNIKLKKPFPVLKFAEAFNRFGSDKPDLRYGFELEDCTDLFQDSPNQFTNLINAGGIVGGIQLPNLYLDEVSFKALRKLAKDNGVSLEFYSDKASSLKQPLDLPLAGTILLVAHKSKTQAWTALGAIRNELKYHLNLVKPNQYSFCWIVDFPLYEFDEKEQKWVSAHNMFSNPQPQWLVNFENHKAEALSEQYDLVLNGFELGSGSIRIHDPEVQTRLMQSLGVDPQQFGFVMEAYQYGAPVHAGMGLGLDRLMMIINNVDNIREVMAFPKNAQGIEMHTNAPDQVDIKDITTIWSKHPVK